MEYLVIAGGGLQESLSSSLGEYAPFFWSVVAPVGLGILWLGGIYTLWETWFGRGNDPESGGGFFFKAFFGLVLMALILCSGAALEYLVLGHGFVQTRVLAGFLNLVG